MSVCVCVASAQILAAMKPIRALVFFNSAAELEAAFTYLKAKHVRVDTLMSTKGNFERRAVLHDLTEGALQVGYGYS